jgi:hypothetical protein
LVLTNEHLTEPVQTTLSTYQPNFKKLTDIQNCINQTKCFVLKTRSILKISWESCTNDMLKLHAVHKLLCSIKKWKADGWMMNWKGCGRKWLWPKLRYYPNICLEELRRTTETLSHGSRWLGWDLNSGPLSVYNSCYNSC